MEIAKSIDPVQPAHLEKGVSFYTTQYWLFMNPKKESFWKLYRKKKEEVLVSQILGLIQIYFVIYECF